MRLAARDCAGEAVVEFDLEATVEATRERALRDIVLWLSRACLRRSRILFRALEYAQDWDSLGICMCLCRAMGVWTVLPTLDCGGTGAEGAVIATVTSL
jgi:hypothetical protein